MAVEQKADKSTAPTFKKVLFIGHALFDLTVRRLANWVYRWRQSEALAQNDSFQEVPTDAPQNRIWLAIGMVAVSAIVFGIYFLFSAPAPHASETSRSEQFTLEDAQQIPPPVPTYDATSLPQIEVGKTLEFGTDEDDHPLPSNRALLTGWSVPELGGIWSLGKDAAIGFVVHCESAVCVTDNAVLRFEGIAFVVPRHTKQTIEVWVGQRKVDQVVLSTTQTKFTIGLDGVAIKDSEPIILLLHLPDAIVQGTVTRSDDPREVAFRIKSLQLEL